MININGQGLQRKYSNGSSSNLKTIAQKTQQQKDHEALRKASLAKREAREARAEKRQARSNNANPEVAIKILEENPEKDINVAQIQKQALSKTNALAREFGLSQPNNAEALAHDRLHCSACDRKLDQPNAHKSLGIKPLFEDEDIRLLCCWCFGKMGESDIKSSMYSGLEADAKVRLQVYNPIESTKAEVDSLIESKMIQMKSKLKKWQQDVALVGNIKHDYLIEGDKLENTYRDMAKTRYTACTW
ncbi:MAG: hypothetical protein DRI84_09665 [Bacteroidetes bacterium]|jgi:hypothetical protein|nr:MAG: hypothetical protein DRI84_09665 [Bacteroidota bacterium]